MKRDVIKLSYSQHRDLCDEEFLMVDEKEIPVEVVQRKYDFSSRHTEHHHLIFKTVADSKFYKVSYQTSVKDSMGWYECNHGLDYDAVEVFPENVTVTVYK